jgi:hypothetical protein
MMMMMMMMMMMITPWSRVLEKLIVTQLVKKFPHFMEPDVSSPCLKQPATGPYHQADEPSSQLAILFI